jgi:hypothetical protein
METGMTSKLRNTGIGPVGYRPWGTHFCSFYATKTDLVEMLVPYFKAGLENKEFCVWVLSEPVTEPEAWNALRETIPELDEYLADRCIEILHGRMRYRPKRNPPWQRCPFSPWTRRLRRYRKFGESGALIASMLTGRLLADTTSRS